MSLISRHIIDEITDYGSGGQSPATSDPIEEDVPRLSSKTSLTPSDSHKVVIEVLDSDAENSRGIYLLLYMILIKKRERVPRVYTFQINRW